MGISYRALYCKSAIISAVFLMVLFMAPAFVQAQESPLTVENIKVDLTAENSVAAQDKAFQEAQLKAFKALADRLVAEGKITGYRTPDPITIGSMVKDYEVTDEKLSAVRYVGTYTFRFRESAVRKYFGLGEGALAAAPQKVQPQVPGTDPQPQEQAAAAPPKPVLVLPFYKVGSSLTVWQDSNIWLQAWGRDLRAGSLPVEIPIGDLMDVSDIGETEGVSFNPSGLARMLGRYNAGDAAIIVASADDAFAAVRDDNAPASGALTLTFYRTDRNRAEAVQELALSPSPGESRGQFMARAVASAYAALSGDWKSKTLTRPSGPAQMYIVHVPLNSISQWMKVQQALRNTGGITQMSVLSLKPREAFVRFSFAGDAALLRDTLSGKGLELGAAYANAGGNRFTGVGNANTVKEIYDLHLAERPGAAGFYRPPGESAPQPGAEENRQIHTF